MAQNPRPSGTIKNPSYPRLSTLAIAAALSACNGEVITPTDGNNVDPKGDGRGGATTVGTPSVAGGMEMPYGGSSATVSSTGGSGINTDTRKPSSGTGGATYTSSIGGVTATGGSGPTDNLEIGGNANLSTTTITVPPISPSIGTGGAPVVLGTEIPLPGTTPVAAGGTSGQATTSNGGRDGTGGARISGGGGTSAPVFTS